MTVWVAPHCIRAPVAHELERCLPHGSSIIGQARHLVGENRFVVLVDADRLTRPRRALEPLANAERAIGIDPPRQVDPELVLLPDFARVELVSAGVGAELGSLQFGIPAHDRLAETQPLTCMGLKRRQIMALRADAHRQHEVGKPRRLRPRRRQCDMAADTLGVAQRFQPAEPVRVRPHWVVDAGEVRVELAPALAQEMRQQDRHLVVAERVLTRPRQFIPVLDRRRSQRRRRFHLVPACTSRASHGADRPGEHVEQEQAAGGLPAAQVACAGRTPVMRCERAERPADGARNLAQFVGIHPAQLCCPLWRVLRICVTQGHLDRFERRRQIGPGLGQVGLPIRPAVNEGAVPRARLEQEVGQAQQQNRFGARPRGQPVVGLGAGIRQPRIDADDLRPALLALDDALCVRVEIVPRLEVARDQEDDLGIGEV